MLAKSAHGGTSTEDAPDTAPAPVVDPASKEARPNCNSRAALSLGAELIYTDAYHNEVQQHFGGRFEFIPQAEFAYRHISDAFITTRNLGTNGIGGGFGVSRSC